MCGIAGFSGAGSEEDLRRMVDRMVHRGPDAEGIWCDKEAGIYLGHRRLSIIDLTSGDQPMWSEDGALGVVFNGEIYNHPELREELESDGCRFRSDHSDTEVLLHGYRRWGEAMVHRLNGMWAFAILDRPRGRLFLSRDRFGKKPLFYTTQGGTFAFASELTALVAHGAVEATVARASLRKYFAYGYIPAPLSIYEGIFKLPGGCSLTLDLEARSHEIRRYWEFLLEPFDSIPRHAERVWGEDLRERLRRAVKRRLMSDVPLGIFLSGGIDSSSIAALAAEIAGAGGIETFSIGFEETSFDESAHADRMAKRIGSRHRNELLSIEQARSLGPDLGERLDEPMGDSSILPTFLLCQVARREVTVALGGDGADELFAGYDPFHALHLAKCYEKVVPHPLHMGIRLLAARLPTSHRNISLDFKIKRTLQGLDHDPRLWNPVWMGPLAPADLEDLFEEPIDIEDVYSEAIEAWESSADGGLVDRTLQFFTRLYLQDDILVKVDRASMLNSLEVRSPYLDVDVVDLVRRIPHRYKYRLGRTKCLLRRALEPLLPGEVLQRSKKGFGVPIGRWFKEGALLFEDRGSALGLAPRFLARKLAEHREGRSDHRLYLWNQWLLDRMLARGRRKLGSSAGVSSSTG